MRGNSSGPHLDFVDTDQFFLLGMKEKLRILKLSQIGLELKWWIHNYIRLPTSFFIAISPFITLFASSETIR
jgi:hypothetical protein